MDEPKTAEMTSGQIQRHFDAGDRFGIASLLERPGFSKFMVRLEYEHYSPDDPKLNDKFQLFLISYGGLTFPLISIPFADKALAEKIAAECDLRFADGVPTLIGESPFPIQHPNIWSTENLPNSPVYSGKAEELRRAEKQWIDDFFDQREKLKG